ncbi:DUF4249 family protein [Aureisphaera galaxeae]|uniref:DUF4249 family protein n=1 Tax=Aureisphaera galaxeae TaxID=1538023 RepID=UPI00234FF609|nr:DUF4249 family protein [Aureisphaera galaxeae]MDC8005013.1 DUF4249 family protein [Aureisphaera galaxeae]
MKKLLLSIFIFTGLLVFSSCEDVVDVDITTEEPRLIIDALVRVDTSEANTQMFVRVAETNSFFEALPPTELSQMTLLNMDNPMPAIFFGEVEPGLYATTISTETLMQDTWVLQINFDRIIFVAFATFQPTSPIESITQGDGSVFDEDDTEVIVSFTDNGDRADFYLFDFDFGNYLVTEDEFYQGQNFEFSYFYEEELNPGDEVEISIMGVDQELYNYMDKLIEQSDRGFGLFETPAATVRGNFVNATDIDNIEIFNNVNSPDNFALGYFAIVQEHKQTFTIQE